MKKLNTGSSAAPAMQRLEAAYAAVEETLADQEVSQAVAADVRPQAPVPQPSMTDNNPFVASPLPEPMIPPAPTEPYVFAVPEPVASSLPSVRVMPVSVPVQTTPIPPAPTQFEQMQAEVPRAPIVSQFTSLADLAQKPHTPYDLPTTLTPQVSVSGDVLFSAEVDDGLDQLLAEWVIFKKSGLFGTGPKGREHPLFKKMAVLQIPLLLAGRFDGATQEIKQSVTDYMNGWRYEQGLIYEKGEIFEHYLRRVIRHILDQQKK
jgi:hypothetical protein